MSQPILAVGSPAPPFTLRAVGGAAVSLADFRGRPVVLYFYPKDDTPGCTKEACSFQQHQAALARQGAVVLGVSRDSVASHERFAKKCSLAFPLLSDPDAAVCKAYGVYKQQSLYGRTSWGIERSTFVINEQGRIAVVFAPVKVDGHTDAVLEALRDMAGARRPEPRRPA